MADDDGVKRDRPATTESSNHPASQARPASTNNESAFTSTYSRVSSKSPQSNPPPASESAVKPPLRESQPMTTSSSASSLPPDQQMETTGASPYGTRSRNRAGNSRPNYAEDRELDMEFEWTSGRKPQGTSGPTVASGLQSGDNEKVSAGNTRRSSGTLPNGLTSSNKATIPPTQNNHLPGMSTFSAYPDPSNPSAPLAPTRKRKAPGSLPVPPHSSSVVPQSSTTGISRRTGSSPQASRLRSTNLMTFDDCQGYLKNGTLKADDGTVLAVNDQVYLVCEPPGEPYYLARIMEFLHVDNDPDAPVDSLRVNWFLRSRDIGRKVNDTRAVFASMQSDTSPITSLRGKCKILHRTDIIDLDLYRKEPNSFWYEKLFDRYIHRFYEVIPTSQVINVPAKVKKVLDERWKFVVLEVGRGRELTSAIKSCKRCQGYCASNDSVDCAVCKSTYHMNCVRPPLLKKPARGFGWSCGPCSRKQEKKLEARNTPIVGEKTMEGEEEEFVDEEEDDHAAASGNGSSPNNADAQTTGARPPTAEQVAQARLWPFRYLGIHCRVEDALDYDDRIYPRASSRLGPKHQATVQAWYGRHVEYVKPTDIRKKVFKGNSHKKDARIIKDTTAAVDANKFTRDKRPKWVMDEPPGYVARGDDYSNNDLRNTAQLKFRLPQVGEISTRGGEGHSSGLSLDQREEVIDEYMSRAKPLAPFLGLTEFSTNFLDKALELLVANDYASEKALQQLRNLNKRKDLKEPELTKEETRRFEDGVRRYGSELRLVSKHVGKTQKHGEIVRFYYMWKKTPEGKRIWGNYEGRKGKKQQKLTDSKLVDDVADDVDDSAFDNGKAAARRRGFECKFCTVRQSPQWRRAPATAPGTTVPIDPSLKSSKDKNAHLMLALCQRCAYLWRCYAITWENPDEVAKKLASGGGRAWKRRIDEELLVELTTANVASSIGVSTTAAAAAASIGVEIPSTLTIQPGQDAPKKKQRLFAETPTVVAPQNVPTVEPPKKKVIEKPPEPPLIPEQPRIRILPCAICFEFVAGEEATDEYLCCTRCRLTVHRNCYGVAEGRQKDKWACDMCMNDTAHQVSTHYDCILCSVREYTDKELMEAPKSHHKKKNDREKEKERLERELLVNATENYYRTQREKGRPEQPRQPLKRTAENNWVHVVCAIFHYEIKFQDPKRLENAEGTGAIHSLKFKAKCKLCKKVEGACVNCNKCQADVHVSCAQQHGYQLGFDITPVKGSRASAINIVEINGDKGSAAAVVYCKEHTKPPYDREEKKGIHSMAEMLADPDDVNLRLNALQAYARSHKQADTSLTGTSRKAQMLDSATSTATQHTNASANHRGSISSVASCTTGNPTSAPITRGSRMSPAALTVRSDEVNQDGDRVVHLDSVPSAKPVPKVCAVCSTNVSPKWRPSAPEATLDYKATTVAEGLIEKNPTSSSQPVGALINGHSNGDSFNAHEDSAAPAISDQPEVTVNGDFGGESVKTNEISSRTRTLNTHALVNGEVKQDSATVDVVYELPSWICNRCFHRQRKEPTPPRTPTPPPESIVPHAADASEDPVVELQAETRMSDEPEPPSSPPPLAWPSQVAQRASQTVAPTPPAPPGPPAASAAPPPPVSPIPPVSSLQTLPPAPSAGPSSAPPAPSVAPVLPPAAPYHGPERLSNGVPHSSPVVAPPPQHYPTPPQTHHSTSYNIPPQTYRDSRGVLHRGIAGPYHVTQYVNGVPVEPPSFQYRRDTSGKLYQVPYVPPALRQQAPTALRSPPMHDRSSQGPHGPPEAAENPFAVPTASHSPPRQAFGGMYGSPSSNHERAETPPGGYMREGRWSGESGLVNGASASPSLRNLLQ